MIDTVSIHVAKTAGTSFKAILRFVYGFRHVCTFYHYSPHHPNLKLLLAEWPQATVLHGHLNMDQIRSATTCMAPDVKLITFLREPRDRMMSFYHFSIHHKNSRRDPNKQPFFDFIADPKHQNEVTKRTEGLSPKDFFFIGFHDRRKQDIQKLAWLLKWPWRDGDYMWKELEQNLCYFKSKVTPLKDYHPTKEEWELFDKWNEADIEFYARARSLFK